MVNGYGYKNSKRAKLPAIIHEGQHSMIQVRIITNCKIRSHLTQWVQRAVRAAQIGHNDCIKLFVVFRTRNHGTIDTIVLIQIGGIITNKLLIAPVLQMDEFIQRYGNLLAIFKTYLNMANTFNAKRFREHYRE